MTARPRPPSTLGRAGAALWRRLTAPPAAGQSLVWSPGELVVLEQACRTADDVASLERLLKRDGLLVTGSKGQSKLSGVPAELRLQRAALTRLVRQLEVSDSAAEEGPRSAASRRAQAAAQARWRDHQSLGRGKHASSRS